MKPDCTVSEHGQLNPVDRLSDLPDFTIHHILSFLHRNEAYRTSILSKRWVHISATFPILHFSYRDFSNGTTSMMEYMDTTMQRYSSESLRISKLTLEFPATDEELGCNAVELACKVDEWLKIAVRNQVVELKLKGPLKYKLPAILFSAKSLKCLDCSNVKIPYYKAIDLVSLENFDLEDVFIEGAMLNHIISCCLLLKTLCFTSCSGFENMVIPHSSKLETLDLTGVNPMMLVVETSSLLRFKCFPDVYDYECWPVISKASLLQNLRILEIYYSKITDKDVDELLSGLTMLETLKLCSCFELTAIRVSSTRLKEVNLNECYELLDVKIDAPTLRKFRYCGYFDPSLSFSMNSQANCDISLLLIPPGDLGNREFLILKKLLTGISSCNVLKIVLFSDSNYQAEHLEIQFDEEELGNILLGPPCYVRELKLKLNLLHWIYSVSSVTAFLDGLFWTCHPDVISLHGDLGAPKVTIKYLVRLLKNMAECWRHPLKRIQPEGANCSKLNNGRWFDVQLRLYWRIPDYTEVEPAELNPVAVDRLSELPDFIIHRILSFLGRNEAYRTSILSKRWILITATYPVLWFSYRDFYDGTTAMMEYMETRMQRQSKDALRITKLAFEFPAPDDELGCNAEELACKVDEWLKIAAHNQVVELELRGPAKYKLPRILFTAESLKCLYCSHVKIPYYKAITPISLVSLESLDLEGVFIEDAMLNHIISSCPLLKKLGLCFCSGFKNMVIPHHSKLETLDLANASPMTVILETSSLTSFIYLAKEDRDVPWPIISNARLLRHLRILEIYILNITDEVVVELLSELTLLETLRFCDCPMLSTIKISSTQLKEIELVHCDNLLDVRIDAPNLRMFGYNGSFDSSLSITINSQASCDIYLHIPEYLETEGVMKLKNILMGLSSCNVFNILLREGWVESDYLNIQIYEDENIHLGPPCYVRELKLNLTPWISSESRLSTFLYWVFWTCHPDVISLHVDLVAPNDTVESMIRELKRMAERRSHPLKRVEAEGVNCSKLLNGSKFYMQFRLYW